MGKRGLAQRDMTSDHWYFNDKENGRGYFFAYGNAKRRGMRRRFDAQTGAFIDEISGDYGVSFAEFFSNELVCARWLGLIQRCPNSATLGAGQLPAKLLTELKLRNSQLPPTQEERLKVFPELVKELFRSVRQLHDLFDRRFTLDGHVVGSIGEVVAAQMYNLRLLPTGAKTHDAKTSDGRLVQIKLTGGNRGVILNSEPQYLIVLQLCEPATFIEVYNGPGEVAWNAKPRPNGDPRPITLGTLKTLQRELPDEAKLPRGDFPNLEAPPAY